MPYKDRSKRNMTDTCDWGVSVHRECPPCMLKIRKLGFCRIHYRMMYEKIIYNKCTISTCENDRDSFGDEFCTKCGELNDRAKCECGNTVAGVRSTRCVECKNKRRRVCHNKTCNNTGTKEFFGRYFCVAHYPERQLCTHLVTERQCRGKWFKGVKPLCVKHGAPKKGRNELILNPKGRCSVMLKLKEPVRCKTRAMNRHSKLCKYHDTSNKCRYCDKRALVGPQQLCEDHVEKGDAVWCPTCGKGIKNKNLKCC